MARGERVVVDEAGMLDQDTALALLAVAAETGATVALVGDRAQLPAVGRGGVLDMAAHIRGRTFDMTGVHRFTNPDYAALTVRMRSGTTPPRSSTNCTASASSNFTRTTRRSASTSLPSERRERRSRLPPTMRSAP